MPKEKSGMMVIVHGQYGVVTADLGTGYMVELDSSDSGSVYYPYDEVEETNVFQCRRMDK